MTGAEARLDEAGLSLWLTHWTTSVGGGWFGRRILALSGGKLAGQLDFLVHPDGQALSVQHMEVQPDYQGRHVASVMVDALYAAHPTAWIDHGGRTPEGVMWWDRYTDPDPQRNIHNHPPAEWAGYFDALEVEAQKAEIAYSNRMSGVDGHREAVYRYGEYVENEALYYSGQFREPPARGPDPASEVLHGGMSLRLPPWLHRLVHNSNRDPGERARILLEHVGHGNLPHDVAWHTTEHAAFEGIVQAELFSSPVQPVTHLSLRVLPLPESMVPDHDAKATWVTYPNSRGIPVQLARMSWRVPEQPWSTHSVDFPTPVDAAIGPRFWQDSSPEYRARYDFLGERHPVAGAPSPFVGREEEIREVADRLLRGRDRRTPQASEGAPRPVPGTPGPHQPPIPPPSMRRGR
ncbi:hypothetical protein [Streptomyces lydicus]|uniref:hypothetical protein n=1 Tax=Streptomyces lydicus TaxID=47763 RepID=UPI0010122392|nr:hypothetical protein [Streptomyces lydicus]MCZ1011954.1 hypothetical protein [Streptomyces lydicus]